MTSREQTLETPGTQSLAPLESLAPTPEEKVINNLSQEYSFYTIRPRELKSLTDLCIVLDLDETLVHTFEPDEKKSLTDDQLLQLRSRIYEIEILEANTTKEESRSVIWGVKRPSLKLFLIFCHVYFKVIGIWSAGTPRYVEKIVDQIFKDTFPPHVIFDRNKTIITEDNIVVKPLEEMLKEEHLEKMGMSLRNTFIIDDRRVTFSENEFNGIKIPAYSPRANFSELMSDDPALKQLLFWFLNDEVMNVRDVKILQEKKEKIFKEPYNTHVLKKCKMDDMNRYAHCRIFFDALKAIYQRDLDNRNWSSREELLPYASKRKVKTLRVSGR
jgi:hypothetical protein